MVPLSSAVIDLRVSEAWLNLKLQLQIPNPLVLESTTRFYLYFQIYFLYSQSRLNHTYIFSISVLLHKDRSTPTHFIQAKAAYGHMHVLVLSVTWSTLSGRLDNVYLPDPWSLLRLAASAGWLHSVHPSFYLTKEANPNSRMWRYFFSPVELKKYVAVGCTPEFVVSFVPFIFQVCQKDRN